MRQVKYDKKSRRAEEIEAYLELIPDGVADEVEIEEVPDGYHVSLATGEARTGFGLSHREMEAVLQITHAGKTLAEQVETLKAKE